MNESNANEKCVEMRWNGFYKIKIKNKTILSVDARQKFSFLSTKSKDM